MKKVKRVKNPKKKPCVNAVQKRIVAKKKSLLNALEQCNGLAATACQMVGISRPQFYVYVNEDEEFREAYEAIQERLLDFSETQLHYLIRSGEPSAVYFHLKCRGKQRGYVEKSQFEYMTNAKKQKTIIGGQEIEFE